MGLPGDEGRLLVLPPPGFVDINGPFHRCGALYQGDVDDGIHLPVLDEGATCLTVLWWVFSLYFSLRGLSRVEDELSEISLINQILEVSEGPAFDDGITHPVMEGAIIQDSGPFRFCDSGRVGRLTQGWSFIMLNT